MSNAAMVDSSVEVIEDGLINPDPYCEVKLAPVIHRGKTTDKMMVEIQNASGDYVTLPGVRIVHGENYRLIPNKMAHDYAQTIVRESNIPFVPIVARQGSRALPVLWDGRRYVERMYSPDSKFLGPNGMNVMMGMEIRNSYDTSFKFSIAFFAMMCACSNQFHSNHLLGEPFEFSHTMQGGDFDEDAQQGLNRLIKGASDFIKLQPSLNLLAETKVDGMQGFLQLRQRMFDSKINFRDSDVLDELSGCGVTKELGMEIGTKYGDCESYWAIANAYTAVTTHSVRGFKGADHSSKVVDYLVRDAQDIKSKKEEKAKAKKQKEEEDRAITFAASLEMAANY